MKGLLPRGRHTAAPQLCRMLLILACTATMTVTACRKSVTVKDTLNVHQEITPQPVRIGTSTVTIRLTDTTAKPVSHASIQIEADMTHPGMSPIFAPAKETAPGNYEAQISFNMAGDWVLLSHIKLANGQKVQRQLDIKDVRAH